MYHLDKNTQLSLAHERKVEGRTLWDPCSYFSYYTTASHNLLPQEKRKRITIFIIAETHGSFVIPYDIDIIMKLEPVWWRHGHVIHSRKPVCKHWFDTNPKSIEHSNILNNDKQATAKGKESKREKRRAKKWLRSGPRALNYPYIGQGPAVQLAMSEIWFVFQVRTSPNSCFRSIRFFFKCRWSLYTIGRTSYNVQKYVRTQLASGVSGHLPPGHPTRITTPDNYPIGQLPPNATHPLGRLPNRTTTHYDNYPRTTIPRTTTSGQLPPG